MRSLEKPRPSKSSGGFGKAVWAFNNVMFCQDSSPFSWQLCQRPKPQGPPSQEGGMWQLLEPWSPGGHSPLQPVGEGVEGRGRKILPRAGRLAGVRGGQRSGRPPTPQPQSQLLDRAPHLSAGTPHCPACPTSLQRQDELSCSADPAWPWALTHDRGSGGVAVK